MYNRINSAHLSLTSSLFSRYICAVVSTKGRGDGCILFVKSEIVCGICPFEHLLVIFFCFLCEPNSLAKQTNKKKINSWVFSPTRIFARINGRRSPWKKICYIHRHEDDSLFGPDSSSYQHYSCYLPMLNFYLALFEVKFIEKNI